MSNIEDVIEKLGLEKPVPAGDEIRCLCPFHEDSSQSFSINTVTGKWICFTGCGAGTIVSLVMRMNNLSYPEAQKLVYGEDTSIQVNAVSKEEVTKHTIIRVDLPDEMSKITQLNECPRYLSNRLQFETIKHFGLGKCNSGYYQHRIIIPIMYKQLVAGYVARDYSGNAEKKYLFPKGFKSRDFLFNYDNINSSEVILVEGVFDAMAMYEKGFKNTVCIFGSDISPRQVTLLSRKNVKSVVLCLDNDASKPQNYGLIAATLIARRFKYYFDKVHIMQLPSSRDPDECNQIELSHAYRSRRIITSQKALDVNGLSR